MVGRLTILFLVVGTLVWMAPTQGYAVSLQFSSTTVTASEGTSFTVDLLADIGVSEQIIGWDIDLLYDSSQVMFTGGVVGSSWNSVFPVPDDDVSLAALAPFGLPPGQGIWGDDVLLATLSFDCLSVGTSLLDIGADDPLEGFQLAAVPAFASWSSEAATVDQEPVSQPVPEPCTLLLMGAGLACLAGLRRKSEGN